MPLQTDALLHIQDLDLRIGRLSRERVALDNGAELKAGLDAAATAFTDAEARLHQLHADQTAAELELQSLEEKTRVVTKRLYEGRITNPKELQAMEHEIEMFGRQRGRLDERILTLMEETETTEPEVERLRAERADLSTRWEAQVAQYRSEGSRLTAELNRLAQERQQVASGVEPATIRRYEDLRQRGGNLGAVRVEDGRCAGCRTGIPAVTLRRVTEQQQYTHCENCNRFLFPAEAA